MVVIPAVVSNIGIDSVIVDEDIGITRGVLRQVSTLADGDKGTTRGIRRGYGVASVTIGAQGIERLRQVINPKDIFARSSVIEHFWAEIDTIGSSFIVESIFRLYCPVF